MIFFWGTPLKEGKIPEQLRSYVTNLEVHGQLFMKIYIPEVLKATEKTAFVELLKELRFLEWVLSIVLFQEAVDIYSFLPLGFSFK